MHKKSHSTLRSGFTLVELLVVIAIIGVLAAIVLPNVMSFLDSARQTEGVNNARGLHSAYKQFMVENNGLPIFTAGGKYNATDHAQFAEHLVVKGYLDTASYFYSPGDPLIADPAPVPGYVNDSGTYVADSRFGTNNISFEIVLGISERSARSQTPIIWTRGGTELTSGEWTATNQDPYGNQGGVVIRLNGSAQFKKKIGDFEPLITPYANPSATEAATKLDDAIPTITNSGIIGKKTGS